jgi:hypothetical protein
MWSHIGQPQMVLRQSGDFDDLSWTDYHWKGFHDGNGIRRLLVWYGNHFHPIHPHVRMRFLAAAGRGCQGQ